MQDYYKILTDSFDKNQVFINEPMSKHTSFKIGGNADVLISVCSKEEILRAVKICYESKIPFYVIGNGSNLLVLDSGFRGAIIKIAKGFSSLTLTSDTSIYCEAGALLSNLANFALSKSLSGLEFASGIPGTVGGAVYMNAGAYDGEMKDVVTSVDVLDMTAGGFKEVKLTNEQMNFGYRTSIIEKEPHIVLGAEFALKPGNPDDIKAKSDDFNASRKEKQPLDLPSAGSTFKRPKGSFAGKLIMESGLRGYYIGGASISEKHCGFIINNGGATAIDVLKLIDHVQNVVLEKFDVMLKPEIRIIGE